MATKGTRNRKVEATEAQTVLATVKDLDLNKVISHVSDLQINVQNNLASLSAALTSKIQQIDQIDTAIMLKEQRLKELYEIEKEAITLDEMRAQHAEATENYTKECAARDYQWDEADTERQKTWKREEEDHAYQTALLRKKAVDEFEAKLNVAKRQEEERKDSLIKSWNERETNLKKQENEVNDLRKQVGEFDNRLKTEVGRAEAILGNTMKRQYEHEKALLIKDAESRGNVDAMRISSIEKANLDQQHQIKELQIQLASARNDAKEVAAQALQSASGRQVAEALQRVVDTREPINNKK